MDALAGSQDSWILLLLPPTPSLAQGHQYFTAASCWMHVTYSISYGFKAMSTSLQNESVALASINSGVRTISGHLKKSTGWLGCSKKEREAVGKEG